jgi:nitrous oxide reductase
MTESENRRYLLRAGAAIAVVGAVSIGAIGIAAASSDETNAAAQPTSAPAPDNDNGTDEHWGGPWGGPWRGGFGGGFGRGLDDVLGADVDGILHGEVVLSKEGGGTQTVLVQKGAVTAVSATEVTVKSTDGFTTAYAVNGDTKVKADKDEIGAVAKDEEVLVVAPKSGDKHTATVLVDLTDLGWK